MVRHWIDFYNTHKKTLIDGSIEPNCPSGLYDQVTLRKDKEEIIICYNNTVVAPDPDKSVYIVNGAWEKELIIKQPEIATPRKYTVLNCCGRTVSSGSIPTSLEIIPVPPASIVEIR